LSQTAWLAIDSHLIGFAIRISGHTLPTNFFR
jgi:hypothetical protein